MRFFINNDTDYAQRRVVCSFYDNRHNQMTSYIFTGNDVEDINTLAKPIGQLKSIINKKASEISKNLKISINEAKRLYLGIEEEDLYRAQSNYYTTIYRQIAAEVRPENRANSLLDLYFEPVQKRKKLSYELVNAEFKHKMV